MPEGFIECDCISCLSGGTHESACVTPVALYWERRRLSPHLYDGSSRPLLRGHLQPGDCFTWADGGVIPILVDFPGRGVRRPPNSWALTNNPSGGWSGHSVRIIPPDDPRCAWLRQIPEWPHHGDYTVATARAAVEAIDIAKEPVW